MEPNTEIQLFDLIDLISERHTTIRKKIETYWNEHSDMYISYSEWYIMAKIYKKQPSISYVTKTVQITRQAIHKFMKQLQQKGLIEIKEIEGNKKEKCVQLTPLGEECFEKQCELKSRLEQKITNSIGTENSETLKNILKLDWKI